MKRMTLVALALIVMAAFAPQASAKTTTAPAAQAADTIDATAYAATCGPTVAAAFKGLKGNQTVDMGACGTVTRESGVRLATATEIAAAGLPADDDNLKVNTLPDSTYLGYVRTRLMMANGNIGAITSYVGMTFRANGVRIRSFQTPPAWTCSAIVGFSCIKNSRSSEWVEEPYMVRAQGDFTWRILGANFWEEHIQFSVDAEGRMYNETAPDPGAP